jgi:outer membrane protein assembly factor BamB
LERPAKPSSISGSLESESPRQYFGNVLNGSSTQPADAATEVTDCGILTTASDLVFTDGRERYFKALDARNGQQLWKSNLGAQMAAGPMTYQVDGKQYVAVAAGHAIFAFGLGE